MRKTDRQNHVIRLLKEHGEISVAALRDAFGLSEVSIRRLLDGMEKEGVIRRTWGGAVLAAGTISESAYEEKMARNRMHKRAIAQAAYACIHDGEAVYLDSGTTLAQLAALIAEGPKRRIMVVTNAMNIALAFQGMEDLEIVVLGGVFNPGILSCSGVMTADALATLSLDKAFLSGSHLSLEKGLTTPNLHEGDIKRAAARAARETIVLMDAAKWGPASLTQVLPAGQLGTLITDWRLQSAAIDALQAAGARVIVTDPPVRSKVSQT